MYFSSEYRVETSRIDNSFTLETDDDFLTQPFEHIGFNQMAYYIIKLLGGNIFKHEMSGLPCQSIICSSVRVTGKEEIEVAISIHYISREQ